MRSNLSVFLNGENIILTRMRKRSRMAAVVLLTMLMLTMLMRRNTSSGMSELTLRFVFGKVEGNFREESATVVFALRHSQRKRLEMVEGG